MPVPTGVGVASAEPSTTAAAVISFGRFTSVQVNVDGDGNNIVGDAANEPSIAVDPTDRNVMAIGWRQFDTVASAFRTAGVAYSTDRGATWTFPGTLRPGEFASDPVLKADADGNFYYLSLQPGRGPGTMACYIYRSTDGGVTWGLDRYAYGGDKPWFDVDTTAGAGRGAMYLSWNPNINAGCCPPNTFTRSVTSGLTWMIPVEVPAELFTHTIAIGPRSEVYIFGTAITGQYPRVLNLVRSSNAHQALMTPTFDVVTQVDLDGEQVGAAGPNPVGLIGQQWVDVDLSNGPTRGNVYVLSSLRRVSNSDPADVMFARSTNGGLSFSPPMRLNDDATDNGAWQWFGTMSVAPNGRLDVVWNDTRDDPTPADPLFSQLYYTYSLDAGDTWSTPEPVGPPFNHTLGWPQQNKLGDYYDMDSDNNGADLAYAATYNGEQDVYYVRLTPDCNGNGIADVTDIAGGTPDCNGNGIPDSCEPNLDCNGNGTRDICDVAPGGGSNDCNTNFVPDECEPASDCNGNTIQDICDIASGFSPDCNGNGVPDECEPDGDCNGNGTLDACDIALGGSSHDCNTNGVPDECDIASGTSPDDDGDGIPDECRGACCFCGSCGQMPEQTCTAQGGDFKGIGVVCDGAGCLDIPVNDRCAGAIALTSDLQQSVPFDSRCTSDTGPEAIQCEFPNPGPAGNDLWYEYVAPCCGVMTLEICDANFDGVLAVYDGGESCVCPGDSAASLIQCNDDGCGMSSGGIVSIPVGVDTCYLIEVAAYTAQGADVVGSGTLNVSVACDPKPEPAAAEPEPVIKSRYLTLVPPALGEPTAIRVTLDNVNGFPEFNGQVRWLGPPVAYPEENSAIAGLTFWGARLLCEPFFTDWGDYGLVHVFGGEILPESLYTAQIIREVCAGADPPEAGFSDPLSMEAGVWGDVIALFAGSGVSQPDFNDIAAVVAKFIADPAAPIKASAQLQANTPKPDDAISFKDIAAAVAGFLQEPYPFSGPCACPSSVTCDATPCATDTVCAPGMCLEGFCTDPCGRCSP